MIHYIHGDLLETKCDYICHQVNCQGAMNSGVAKQIRNKWPKVYNNYEAWCKEAYLPKDLLGSIQIIEVDRCYVVNLYSQENYGYNNLRYTNYEAFYNAISHLAIELKATPEKTIAFPYKIGCDRGGANWNIICTMIDEVFYDKDVYIYYLSEVDLLPEDRARLMK